VMLMTGRPEFGTIRYENELSSSSCASALLLEYITDHIFALSLYQDREQ
jgi:hypothetical protein